MKLADGFELANESTVRVHCGLNLWSNKSLKEHKQGYYGQALILCIIQQIGRKTDLPIFQIFF